MQLRRECSSWVAEALEENHWLQHGKPSTSYLLAWRCKILSLLLGAGRGKEKLCCVVLLEVRREEDDRGERMTSQKDRQKLEVWVSTYAGVCTGNGQCYVYLGKCHRLSTYEGKEANVWGTARGPSSETYTREDGLSSLFVLRYMRSLQE